MAAGDGEEMQMKSRLQLIICPNGHSFVTTQTLSHLFLCPECGESFEELLGYRFDIH